MPDPALVWLRNDLRVADNPALAAAVALGGAVVALHVEETAPRVRPRGAAARWWLNRSLTALAADLAGLGIALETATGGALEAIAAQRPRAVFWNRRYAPGERAVDAEIETALIARGVPVRSFAGPVLAEPFEIATKAVGPYGVFTPFWTALRGRDIALPVPAPAPVVPSLRVPVVDTAYRAPGWTQKLARHWVVGEAAARERLGDFLEAIADYPTGRDRPDRSATSRLSPHLAFGEISPRQVWHAALALAVREPGTAEAVQGFLRELAWRDFNYHQLYHRPDIAEQPMQERFRGMRWREAASDLAAWQRGETGFALVDAGMRELWETGFMHNRVRMVSASMLTKNLLIDWRLGERWFWDCLVDADVANNAGNWQWVAGCGTDAAPFFRIFNPEAQARRFDPDGTYVRRWTSRWHEPIVDPQSSRQRALAVYRAATGRGPME